MPNSDQKTHWENVYSTKSEREVSWYQDSAEPSLELIAIAGGKPDYAFIDIGGGASRLVDTLLKGGYRDLTVLDLSSSALDVAKARIGNGAEQVNWIAADVTRWQPDHTYDIWHDRAAFHFLTSAEHQAAYVQRLNQALRPGGHAIIGTFAPDGPEKCSGLAVARHDSTTLTQTLGPHFDLVHSRRHEHITPWQSSQQFQFSIFRRNPAQKHAAA